MAWSPYESLTALSFPLDDERMRGKVKLSEHSMGYMVLFHAALETAKISLPTVIDSYRRALRQEDCDTRLRRWAARVLGHVGAKVSVDGLEHVSDVAGPFVVVSNHQSYYDIPVMYSALPLPLRMAAKAELFNIPLWGQALSASGFVLIDRKNPERAHQALREAGERMRKSGMSLYVAPEGTRTSDGSLGRFKAGAFRMAQVMNLPILPVAISGTYLIHKKGEKSVSRGCQVQVRVLAPLAPDESQAPEKRAELARARIAAALADLAREAG